MGGCLQILAAGDSGATTRAADIHPSHGGAVRLDRRADFLAQLIAARDGLPQARTRRRCEPAIAVQAYAEAARLVSGPGFSRTLHI